MAVIFTSSTRFQAPVAGNLDSSLTSWLSWMNLDGYGSALFARILNIQEDENSDRLLSAGVGNSGAFTETLNCTWHFDTGGTWRPPQNTLTTGVWFCVAATMDMSSDQNDPIFYVLDSRKDNTLKLVTTTQTTAPSGNRIVTTSGYQIGGRADGGRDFDGRIAYLQYWTRILTLKELRQACFFPGSVKTGLKIDQRMEKADGYDSSPNNVPATNLLNLTTGPGPPMVYKQRQIVIAPSTVDTVIPATRKDLVRG